MEKIRWFWVWVIASLIFRLVFIYFPNDFILGSRAEIATPLTSLRRLAEGYWLKQSSMSPYAGSMYHGSPLLLSLLGPLTVLGLLFVVADFVTAVLIRETGWKLQMAYSDRLKSLNLDKVLESSDILPAGDIASLIYLWNPLTIVTCLGLSTSPIENLMVVLSLYGACSGLAPLTAFGWVTASHLSLYPSLLVIPVIFLLGYGPESPPRKLYLQKTASSNGNNPVLGDHFFSWRPVIYFLLWATIWSSYFLFLCSISLKQYGGLPEMFKRTYGFILTVEDLSPNIGVLWYFFAEVFEFFRDFFLIVIHLNILFMILPLAIRLNHRPCFLAFVYIAIFSMLKSYPSSGDPALYLALVGLFVNELADMKFSFFLFCGYVGVALLSPVMHNLWIWRGTGNANFYFATAMGYACLQIILVVDSVSAMLQHDRMLQKLSRAQS
ncbi:hypothetical protein AQUCO_01300401v1 [Aquilegia coerulea]|uniref:GPI transamidase subunit PIG-U n=1 Tax=Aquilegia coerulea TaxID=218851 RepID=A0A2G5E1E0_AQUCA|nr:hypothetical protein AQUCO_01300401v1 [Aquilegia coerulea]